MTYSSENIEPVSPEQRALKVLTITGWLEGTSFLLLLGIAMPLKYYMGIPELVPYVGMAHGILFIAYLIVLLSAANKIRMPLWAMPAGVIAALLPFGPFIYDAALKRKLGY